MRWASESFTPASRQYSMVGDAAGCALEARAAGGSRPTR